MANEMKTRLIKLKGLITELLDYDIIKSAYQTVG